MARKLNIEDAFHSSLGRKEAFSQAAVDGLWAFLKEAGLEADRRVIDPDPFYWLHPLYDLKRHELLGVKIPGKGGAPDVWLSRPQFERGILFRKASQMGASVWSIVFMLWLCIDLERPLGIACYWPTEKDLQDFIQTRLDPMLSGCPKLQSYMEDTKVDSTRAKQIGRSTIYFRYVKGKASADSIPVDVLLCDEVRLWDTPEETIQRLKERLGQSDVKLLACFSTVGSTGDYMERQWAVSNQIKYFSRCEQGDCHTEIAPDPASPNRVFRGDDLDSATPGRTLIRGVVMSDYLPDQITRLTGFREATYTCPCCGGAMPNLRDGGYVETRPQAEGMYALEFARTLSPRLSAYELLSEYKTARDMKQFMNGYLAKPWLDPEGRPVKEEDWNRAKDPTIQWAQADEGGVNDLGADFRAREMHYVLGEAGSDGQPGRILRVGVYQRSDWKAFLESLILRFHVRRAVIDYMPFTSDTLELADRYQGKVFLAQYKAGPMVKVASQEGKTGRKISPDGREKHMVSLDQVKSLNYSLASFARGHWQVPATPLYQSPYTDRKKNVHEHFDVAEGMEGEGREGFKQHLMCLSLVTKKEFTTNNANERVGESGAQTQEFVDAGGFDPHWAHAFNYMVMAGLLGGGDAALIGSSGRDLAMHAAAQGAHPAGWGAAKLPGVPTGGRIAGFMNPAHELTHFQTPALPRPKRAEVRCGQCAHGPAEGRAVCGALGWEVGADEPRCQYRGVFRPRKLST